MPNQNITPTPQTESPDLRGPEIMQRLLVEAAVLKRLHAAHKDLKDAVARQFTAGEKVTVKNAQGLALGSASMAAPNKKAVCDDQSILLAHADEKGMELVDTLPHPDTDKGQALIEFLLENAPDFLETSISTEDHKELAAGVLEQWQITGELPAGWEIRDASSPTFRLTPGRSKPAVAAVDHLVGQVDDLLAITSGKDEN